MITYNLTCTIPADALTNVVEVLGPVALDLKITTTNSSTPTTKRTHSRVGGGRKLADHLYDHFKGRSVSTDEVFQFGQRSGFARSSVHNSLRALRESNRVVRQGKLTTFTEPKS